MPEKLGTRILWQRARDYVSTHQPIVIALTGNSYYTPLVREALRHILSDKFNVRAVKKPWRSRRAVAEDILGIDAPKLTSWPRLLGRSLIREISRPEPGVIIVEANPRKPGDIDYIAKQIPWSIVAIMPTHSENLDYFTKPEYMFHEVNSLVSVLGEGQSVILSADEESTADLLARTKANTLTYGLDESATVHLSRLDRDANFGLTGELTVHGKSHTFKLPHITGRDHARVLSSTLAIATALAHDVAVSCAKLHSFKAPAGMLRLSESQFGVTVINDSRASTPEAMLAALENLRAYKHHHDHKQRSIVILDSIKNLSGQSDKWHRIIGKVAGEVATSVITIGPEMAAAGEEALMIGADVHHFQDSRNVAKWLSDVANSGDIVMGCNVETALNLLENS